MLSRKTWKGLSLALHYRSQYERMDAGNSNHGSKRAGGADADRRRLEAGIPGTNRKSAEKRTSAQDACQSSETWNEKRTAAQDTGQSSETWNEREKRASHAGSEPIMIQALRRNGDPLKVLRLGMENCWGVTMRKTLSNKQGSTGFFVTKTLQGRFILHPQKVALRGS